MPLYNTSTTATALGVSEKWLDNLLSRNKIDGVQQARQGISRRLTVEAIMIIQTARALVEQAGMSVPTAVALAQTLVNVPGGIQRYSPYLTVHLQVETLRSTLIEQLAHAVEVTPTPTRGRPRGSPDSVSTPSTG